MVADTWFTILRGRGGDDLVIHKSRGTADGGGGHDKCRLGPGAEAIDCERHTLICQGPGEPLPGSATSITTRSPSCRAESSGETLDCLAALTVSSRGKIEIVK